MYAKTLIKQAEDPRFFNDAFRSSPGTDERIGQVSDELRGTAADLGDQVGKLTGGLAHDLERSAWLTGGIGTGFHHGLKRGYPALMDYGKHRSADATKNLLSFYPNSYLQDAGIDLHKAQIQAELKKLLQKGKPSNIPAYLKRTPAGIKGIPGAVRGLPGAVRSVPGKATKLKNSVFTKGFDRAVDVAKASGKDRAWRFAGNTARKPIPKTALKLGNWASKAYRGAPTRAKLILAGLAGLLGAGHVGNQIKKSED